MQWRGEGEGEGCEARSWGADISLGWPMEGRDTVGLISVHGEENPEPAGLAAGLERKEDAQLLPAH